MRAWSAVLSLFVVGATVVPSAGRDALLRNQAVTCVATTPDVLRMSVEEVGFAFGVDHSAAHARVRLELRDHSERSYAVSGQANRITKNLAPNSGGRSIAYGGVECTFFHRNVTAVRDCRGTPAERTCEVGVAFDGENHAYLVSVSIKPIATVQPVELSH